MDTKIKRGQILKELRIQKGLKQAEVAEQMEITQQAYQRYENGTSEPNADGFSFLADFYGVTVDYLLGREKAPDPLAALPAAETERELLSGYFDLPPQQRADFCETLLKIVERRKGRSRIAETTTAGALQDRLATDAAAEESAG